MLASAKSIFGQLASALADWSLKARPEQLAPAGGCSGCTCAKHSAENMPLLVRFGSGGLRCGLALRDNCFQPRNILQ